jgi:hypothetical protein
MSQKFDFQPDKKPLFIEIDPKLAWSFLFVGSTRSGKSTLMKHCIDRFVSNKVNCLMTLSPQAEIYGSKEFVNNCVICPKFEPRLIKKAYKINKNTNNHYEFNFIVDDIGTAAKNNKELKNALTLYRNSGIGIMISSQSLTLSVGKSERNNVNFVFLGKCNGEDLVRDVIKAYLSSWFPSEMKMDDRIRCYKEITKGYHWIFINNLTDEIYVTKISKT